MSFETITSAADDLKTVSANDSGRVSDGCDAILQPGRLIRPMISPQVAIELVQRLYGLAVKKVTELNSYDDRNFLVTVEPHKNPFIKEIWPYGYVLKVLNSMDSCKNHIDAEHEVQKILATNGISCPQPVLNIKGQDKSLEDIAYDLPPDSRKGSEWRGLHLVRLLTFVPGGLVVNSPLTKLLLNRVGRYLASIENALEGFHHPSLDNHKTIWSLDSVPLLLNFISAVRETENRQIVEDVIQTFMQQVIPNKGNFRKGVIHGDFNEQNILVKEGPRSAEHPPTSSNSNTSDHENDFEICGILDFGDTSYSYYIYDVAIAIMYMMLCCKEVDLLDVGGYFLAGYQSSKEQGLNEAEFKALKVCVAARYAQSLIIGAYTHSLNPTNDYLLTSAKNGWNQLRKFWGTPTTLLYERWRSIMEASDKGTNNMSLKSP